MLQSGQGRETSGTTMANRFNASPPRRPAVGSGLTVKRKGSTMMMPKMMACLPLRSVRGLETPGIPWCPTCPPPGPGAAAMETKWQQSGDGSTQRRGRRVGGLLGLGQGQGVQVAVGLRKRQISAWQTPAVGVLRRAAPKPSFQARRRRRRRTGAMGQDTGSPQRIMLPERAR
jgi:hypothetical protein